MHSTLFLAALALASCASAQSNVRQGGLVRADDTEQLGYRCEINYGDRWTQEGDHAVNINLHTFAAPDAVFEALSDRGEVNTDPASGRRTWQDVSIPGHSGELVIRASALLTDDISVVDGEIIVGDKKYITTIEAADREGADALREGDAIRAFFRSVVARDLVGFGCFVPEE